MQTLTIYCDRDDCSIFSKLKIPPFFYLGIKATAEPLSVKSVGLDILIFLTFLRQQQFTSIGIITHLQYFVFGLPYSLASVPFKPLGSHSNLKRLKP